MLINVLISDPEYLGDLLGFQEIGGIYVEQERLTDTDMLRDLLRRAHQAGKRLYVALPYIWNLQSGRELERVLPLYVQARVDGYLVRNIDELGLVTELEAPGEIILDGGMYTWNKEAMKTLGGLGATRFTAPYELNAHELAERGFEATELMVYGNYPMMISSGCLQLTTGKCIKDTGSYSVYRLRDRKGVSFPAVNCCKYCYNIIYNSVPLWLLDEPEIEEAGSLRFSFTTESREQMLSTLERIFRGDVKPGDRFTRGHYRRGAE